jgi:hypothetical protein
MACNRDIFTFYLHLSSFIYSYISRRIPKGTLEKDRYYRQPIYCPFNLVETVFVSCQPATNNAAGTAPLCNLRKHEASRRSYELHSYNNLRATVHFCKWRQLTAEASLTSLPMASHTTERPVGAHTASMMRGTKSCVFHQTARCGTRTSVRTQSFACIYSARLHDSFKVNSQSACANLVSDHSAWYSTDDAFNKCTIKFGSN